MRDIYTRINNLRRQVFSAVANLAYEDRDLSEIVEIPFEILPGEIASIRERRIPRESYPRRENPCSSWTRHSASKRAHLNHNRY